MKPMSVQTIAEYCGGRLVSGDGARVCTRASTDSRSIQAGDLFVALVGEKFDAHDFVPQVAQAGATAVIVSRAQKDADSLACAVIEVTDTLEALQRLAHRHRALLDPVVIGITGSNGKTSTKDFASAVMRSKFEVFATAGNLNNHIGVPLTLLSLEERHTCAVVEMGMNHPGEIAPLCAIAEPDAAIITNIGVAHIEFMGSRAGIAQEKGVLAESVSSSGVVVLNANDEYTPSIAARCKAKVITAGVGQGDVRATIHESGAQGSRFTLDFGGSDKVEVSMPVPGEHMVANAALAAACAWHHGIAPAEIAAALNAAQVTKGRLQVKHWRGVVFLDDSYNANPDSMRAGLKTLAGMQVAGRRAAVLGRMGELGPLAEQGHREVGEFAAQCRIDAVFTVGAEAGLINKAAQGGVGELKNFESHADCAAHLRQWLKEGDAVLLKGSRSAGMEQVFTQLESA
jgi:UDP-N-acetylmuramoyl-tripeptide--D-alanyl-D-alanine ligase